MTVPRTAVGHVQPSVLLGGTLDLFSDTVSIALFIAWKVLGSRVLTEIQVRSASNLKQQF